MSYAENLSFFQSDADIPKKVIRVVTDYLEDIVPDESKTPEYLDKLKDRLIDHILDAKRNCNSPPHFNKVSTRELALELRNYGKEFLVDDGLYEEEELDEERWIGTELCTLSELVGAVAKPHK